MMEGEPENHGYETNDWNGYILVETCKQCRKNKTPLTSPSPSNKKLRQSSDMSFLIPTSKTVELEHKLLKEIAFLRAQNVLCDVYLRCDDGTIFSAHKLVLSAVSPYFKAMFHSNMVEKTQAIINIQGVESGALKSLIDFAYTAKIMVTANNIFDILTSANMLRFEDVEETCVEFLCKNLNIENCVDIFTIAEVINSEELHQIATMYVTNNFRRISRDPNFIYFSPAQLETLLSSDDIDVSSEVEVFEAVMAWVRYDSINRKPYLPRLLKHVRLILMSRKYLIDIVLREHLVMSEEETRNIVLNALDYHILPERNCPPSTSTLSRSPRLVANRTLYVIGGQVRGNAKSSGESYNFKTKSWSPLSPMRYPRHHSSAVVLDGSLYVLGGIHQGKDLASMEKYNPVTETWTTVACLKKCKGALAAVTIDGWIYAVGGSDCDSKESLKCVEQYDPIADTWTTLPDMRLPRSHFGVARLHGRLYAIGGYCGISELEHCEYFDPSFKTWTETIGMNKPRMDHAVVAFKNRLYVFGGKNSMGLVNSIERYNPEINMWLVIKTNFEMRLGMNVCLGGACGSYAEETVFVVGGSDKIDEKGLRRVTTVCLKSPDFYDGLSLPMLEERISPAVALL